MKKKNWEKKKKKGKGLVSGIGQKGLGYQTGDQSGAEGERERSGERSGERERWATREIFEEKNELKKC